MGIAQENNGTEGDVEGLERWNMALGDEQKETTGSWRDFFRFFVFADYSNPVKQ